MVGELDIGVGIATEELICGVVIGFVVLVLVLLGCVEMRPMLSGEDFSLNWWCW